MTRTCYICAEHSSDVTGRIPLCDWCADKHLKRARLRPDLRSEAANTDANHAYPYGFTYQGN